MSCWTAPAECYLVDNDTRPLAGPFSRSTPLIALIDRLYHRSGRVFAYGNASRYRLAKEKFFPGTKAGDAALKAALRCSDLEQRVLPLLGPLRPVLGAATTKLTGQPSTRCWPNTASCRRGRPR